MTTEFTWIPFYQELANELTKWKDRQSELISFLVNLRNEGYKVTSMIDKDSDGSDLIFEELDPFSFFASFTRSLSEENQLKILNEIKNHFRLESSLPTDFNGLPQYHPLSSRLLGYKYERDEKEVEILWDTFILALSTNPLENEEFLRSLDLSFQILPAAARRITIGLFWICPYTLLSLDRKNCQYLGIEFPDKLTSEFYVNTIRDVSKKYESFPELSYDAWIDSQIQEPSPISVVIGGRTAETREEYRSDINYWIFQCNPNLYDIESAIQELDVLTFLVNQHKNEIKKNDKVFLWVSGENAGIIAISEILSNPAMITAESPDESDFAIDKERFEGEQLRVKLHVKEILKKRLTKDVINQHVELMNLSIIRSPQGTNFSLSHEEAKTLFELIKDNVEPPILNEEYTLDNLIADLGFDRERINNWLNAIKRKKQVVFYGPPGTGKTFAARKIAKYITNKDDGFMEIVQFHPSYAYEDFIQGIRPVINKGGQLSYSLDPGRLLKFCEEARKHLGNAVLIIDEINRADLSRVFGELLYLLEYREETITLASGEDFSLPENIILIGTMNTADRSIALVDHALRRRFSFLRLFPDYKLLRRYHHTTGLNVDGLIQSLKTINTEIGDPNYSIGVTFFLSKNLENEISDIWQMEIEPYLEEYFFDDQSKVDKFRWNKMSEQILY